MTELRTERHEEEELSTADMANAANRPEPAPVSQRDPARPAAAARPQVSTIAPKPAPAADNTARGLAMEPAAPRAAAAAGAGRSTPLFSPQEAQEMHSSWDSIQTGFVDDPRRAVEQADHLVAQTIKRLAEMFANERNQLEQQWSRGDNVSTEDLRVALQRYRSFFDRLLSF
jgi:hypothetical protein